jgi:hypothetical protein
MGNMLRNQSNAGSHCSCCNDPYRDNPRAFEKREWRKEVEEEITWVDGPQGKIPYNIQTQAGREIWTIINNKGGSGYWGPLGRALPEVEAEAMRMAEERIIAILEALATHFDCQFGEHHEDWVCRNPLGIIEVLTKWDSEPVALIKGENK